VTATGGKARGLLVASRYLSQPRVRKAPVAVPVREEVSALTAIAVVTRNEGKRIWVDYLGEAVPCLVRRDFPDRVKLVPGDEVEIERLPDASYAVVAALPRRGGLVRLAAGRRDQIMVANVDQVIVILDAGRDIAADRRRVSSTRAKVLLAVNKCDLEDEASARSRVAPLVEDGADVVMTSALTGRGLGDLRSRLQGHVSAVVGVSGAGKTSLLQALYPGYRFREKASELYPLPGGGYLAV
jgi:putative ribosome biogenesis GTPase RsgA